MNFWPRHVTKRDLALDKVVAVLLLCLSIIFVVWPISLKHYDIFIPGIFLVSSLLYLLLRRRVSESALAPRFKSGDRFRLISHIIFMVCLSLSIWLFWHNLYYRPPLYFVLLVAAATSIIWDILSADQTKRSHTFVPLFKIIVLSLAVYGGIYYQFPGILGVDPWLHNQWMQETLNLGHITQGQYVVNSYYLLPVFHLAVSTTHIMTGLSTYSSAFVAVGFLLAVSCLFTFLIGRRLFDARTGLLAALIVPLASRSIEFGTIIIPMSLGFCFFSTILYLVLCSGKKRVFISLLVIILSATLILTHTIAALVMLLSLCAIFVGIKFYKLLEKRTIQYKLVSLTIILLFGVAMLARWMQALPNESSFFDINITALSSSLQDSAKFALSMPLTTKNISYAVKALDEGGNLLILAFAVFGALISLHTKNRTAAKTALVVIAATIFAIPYIFQMFSVTNILPDRWVVFQYVSLSILAMYGLSGLFNVIKGNTRKLGMVTVVMLVVIFLMITNSTASRDSPLIFNGAVRIGYTQSELSAVKTLSDAEWGRPETDIYYGYIFPFLMGYNEYVDMIHRDNEIFIQRNYYLQHPEWDDLYETKLDLGGINNISSKQVLISDYIKKQGINNCPLVYDNGHVTVYATTYIK